MILFISTKTDSMSSAVPFATPEAKCIIIALSTSSTIRVSPAMKISAATEYALTALVVTGTSNASKYSRIACPSYLFPPTESITTYADDAASKDLYCRITSLRVSLYTTIPDIYIVAFINANIAIYTTFCGVYYALFDLLCFNTCVCHIFCITLYYFVLLSGLYMFYIQHIEYIFIFSIYLFCLI